MRIDIVLSIILFILSLSLFIYTATQYYNDGYSYGYVSDEAWYVSSARNILNMYGLHPRFNGLWRATLILPSSVSYDNVSYIASGYNSVSLEYFYKKIHGVYVIGDRYEIESMASRLNASILWGWIYPDADYIDKYLNLEHPPMGKYLIALSMLVIGDNPIAWKIPSCIAGALTCVIIYMVVNRVSGNRFLAILSSLIYVLDPIVRTMSSVAMLDIYVALFTALTLYFVVVNKLRYALLILLIGGLFKFTALLLYIPVGLMIALRSRSINDVMRLVSHTMLLYASMLVVVSTPLILGIGFENWVYKVIVSIRWHTSIKCLGAGCPTSSSPWDWFLGVNSFPIYCSREGCIRASGFYQLWFTTLALSIFVFPYKRLSQTTRRAVFLLLGLIAGYIFLWILGSRSMYSFYSIQFTPIIYVVLPLIFHEVILDINKLSNVVRMWRNGLTMSFKLLRSLLSYPC